MTNVRCRKPLFDISSKAALSSLLGFPAGEIDYVVFHIERFYVREELPKASGGTRLLLKPRGRLKEIQAEIKKAILDKVPPLPFVHGGVRGRSVMTNAAPHVRKEVVLAADIKDCFPSISPRKVLDAFIELGISGEAARILTELTTVDSQLPQGTKTSPALANLVLRSIDRRLSALASQHGGSYKRFVDDVQISGPKRLAKLRGLVRKIFASEGFKLKPKKEVMLQSEPQVVTKLLVNQRVNVTKDRRAAIRKEVFSSRDEGQLQVSPSTIGKVRWLASVNPEVGSRLISRIPPAKSAGPGDSAMPSAGEGA